MFQDEHRRLARHPRDLAEDEFIGYQVGEHRDGDPRKCFDDVTQVLCVRIHMNSRLSHAAHDFGVTPASCRLSRGHLALAQAKLRCSWPDGTVTAYNFYGQALPSPSLS